MTSEAECGRCRADETVVATVTEQPALDVEGLSKSFGPVRALDDVSLQVRHGQVLGLLGDNGAGKSTLVKCLSGVLQPDRGHIRINGATVAIQDPTHARALGIETVHQDLSLISTLNVAANLFLNRELRRRGPLGWIGWLDKRQMAKESRAILERFGINIPSMRMSIDRLSGGQRQAVAVSRAAGWGDNIVIMDEPSAALGVEQSRHVLELIDNLRQQGVALILITHNMQQAVEVCDRAVILRHGLKVGDVRVADVTSRDLVDLITGATRSPAGEERREEQPSG